MPKDDNRQHKPSKQLADEGQRDFIPADALENEIAALDAMLKKHMNPDAPVKDLSSSSTNQLP